METIWSISDFNTNILPVISEVARPQYIKEYWCLGHPFNQCKKIYLSVLNVGKIIHAVEVDMCMYKY